MSNTIAKTALGLGILGIVLWWIDKNVIGLGLSAPRVSSGKIPVKPG